MQHPLSPQMLPKMDASVPPCTSLYDYACGGWSSSHSKPPPTRPRWDLQQEMDLKLSESLRAVIATLPHPTKTNSLSWKLKNFYESCMSLDNIETDGDRPLKKIIQELGGWSVLREFSVLSWDFSHTLVRLHAEHGVTPFFTVSVVPDPDNSTRTIIRVAPSGLGLPDISYYYREKTDKMSSSYRRYMKDVVQQLGANSIDANAFAEDIFYFERRIAEVTPSPVQLADVRSQQKMTVAALKVLAPSIHIHAILNAMFAKADVDDNTLVLVTSSFYMTKVSNIISTIDRSALNNYLMWCLAKEYLPYLSQTFLDTHYLYNRDMTGATEPLERWEFCIKTLSKYMAFGLSGQLERTRNKEEREREAVLLGRVFDNVRDAVRDSITKANWVDLELYKHLVSKLDGTALQVGYPSPYLDDTYFEEYYSKLYVQKNDLFRNIQYGVSFIQEESKRRYVAPKEEYNWIRVMASETAVTLVPFSNKLLVPSRLLVEPLFHSDLADSPLVYGSLGVAIARELVSSLVGVAGLSTASGTLLPANSLVANLSVSAVDHQLQCLVEADPVATNTTSLNTFINIAAVKQALKALKKVKKDAPHIHEPGLEYLEDDALFYLTFTQSLCQVQTTQQADRENTTSTTLPNRHLVRLITSQVKSFAEAFACATPSAICKDLL